MLTIYKALLLELSVSIENCKRKSGVIKVSNTKEMVYGKVETSELNEEPQIKRKQI